MSQPKMYRGREIHAAPPGEYVVKGSDRWGCSLTRRELIVVLRKLGNKYNKTWFYGPLPKI